VSETRVQSSKSSVHSLKRFAIVCRFLEKVFLTGIEAYSGEMVVSPLHGKIHFVRMYPAFRYTLHWTMPITPLAIEEKTG